MIHRLFLVFALLIRPAFAIDHDTATLLAGALDLDLGGGGVSVGIQAPGVSIGVGVGTSPPGVGVGVGVGSPSPGNNPPANNPSSAPSVPGGSNSGGGAVSPGPSREDRAREVLDRGADSIRETLRQLAPEDAAAFKARCRDVMRSPSSFVPSLVALCQLIESL